MFAGQSILFLTNLAADLVLDAAVDRPDVVKYLFDSYRKIMSFCFNWF